MKTSAYKFTVITAIILSFIAGCKKNSPDANTIQPLAPPTITGLSVSSAAPNSTISIYGTNFSTTKDSVTFNGVSAKVDSMSITKLVVTVPANATTGKITVTTIGGTATYATNFTVLPIANLISITSFSVYSAIPGSVVSIYGANFSTTKDSVTFNGVAAKITSVSATVIVVTVPANATTGKVSVITNAGTATSPSDFQIVSISITLSSSNQFALKYIAADAAGNVYGNIGTDTVLKMTPSGVVSMLATVGNSHSLVNGIVVDAAGNVYVTSSSDYKVYKVTSAGKVSVFAGSGTSGYTDGQGAAAQFTMPLGLAIDGQGNLYLNDGYRIRKITSGGLVSTLAGSGVSGTADGQGTAASFNTLSTIFTADGAGNVYEDDTVNGNIRKITPAGIVTTLIGAGVKNGIVYSCCTGPNGITDNYTLQAMAADAKGNIFVASYNVRSYAASGVIVNIAVGTGTFSTSILPGLAVSYNSIAFDPLNNLYVSFYPGGAISYINKYAFQE